jgi:uncharacterized protein (UPF0248 family)
MCRNLLMKTSRWRSSPVGMSDSSWHGSYNSGMYCIRGAARKACSIVNDMRLTDGKKFGEEKYTGSEIPLQFIPPPAW